MLVAPLAGSHARSLARSPGNVALPFSACRGSPLALSFRLPPCSETGAVTDRGSPGEGCLPERVASAPVSASSGRLGRKRGLKGKGGHCQEEEFC